MVLGLLAQQGYCARARRALELFALQHVEVLLVVSGEGGLVGLLDRRAILGAYRRRIDELRGRSGAHQ